MKLAKFLFRILLPGVAFVSLIPHLFPNIWLADIFSHFRLQYVILLLVLLFPAVLLVRRRIFPVVFTLILLAWNSWFIVPLYFQDSDISQASGESFSILSINLLASNSDYLEALELIREKDPDMVVLLELSPQWKEEMQVLNGDFPFRKMFPQSDNFGIGILSKIPMQAQVTDFGSGFPPSIHSQLQINDHSVSLLATHPVPPVSQEMFSFRNAQLEEIAKLSRGEARNFVLAGDLNTSSYSKHFQELLEQGDLVDSRKGFGIASTWPADLFILRTTLDHFLLRGNMEVLERTTERSIGSDHLPIFVRLGL